MRLHDMKVFALALLFAVAAIAFHGAPANAQSACKGLAKSKCASNASCSWVGGYKTQAGKSVNAYCRSKGSKGAAKKAGESKVKKARAKADRTKKAAKSKSVSKAAKSKGVTKASAAGAKGKRTAASAKAKGTKKSATAKAKAEAEDKARSADKKLKN